MPTRSTIRKARRDRKQGKSASTQAGEFVHDEIEKIRHGKHGARSAKQAIAIGLSEARRAGVKVPPPGKGSSAATRRKAGTDTAASKTKHKTSATRSRATTKALKKEPTSTVSHDALSRQARSAAARRGPAARKASARKAARTRRRK